ncbi:MAG TPA: phosphatidate cytidylyltransferase [Gammaproteobacteria bacterium]|nr:phosphatidate cytidylyltransferase [Gammaproteobacteria bacterium]
MLKRILTAIVLIPVFILLVLKLSPKAFCLFTAIIVLWAAWEWSFLMGVKQLKYSFIYPVILLFLLIGSMWLYIPGIIIGSFVWWLLALLLVIFYPKFTHTWSKSITIRGLMGWMVLIPCWLAINFIRNIPESGVYILLFLFVLIWGADSGAYFAGKLWGKTKIAPEVSPGKTWEGLAGALVVTLIITVATLYWVQASHRLWLFACLITIVTVLFSVVGDLFESMLKRNEGLKDSGRLIPGHGGILDRIDSLTAAAPVFLFSTDLMQKIFS